MNAFEMFAITFYFINFINQCFDLFNWKHIYI
jgi:hypothetical protein